MRNCAVLPYAIGLLAFAMAQAEEISTRPAANQPAVPAERVAAFERLIAQREADPARYLDRYRPQFHFTAPGGHIGDPNGQAYFNGQWHLCYQYCGYPHFTVPDKLIPGLHWGHAVSTDLLHWKHLPPAIAPDDEFGVVCSGSMVVDEHDASGWFGGKSGLVAAFTQTRDAKPGRPGGSFQCMAFSRDNGRTWLKYSGNPVIDRVPGRNDRDPRVIWYAPGQKWCMVYSGWETKKTHFYSSKNLRDWTLESVVDKSSDCPDLFELPIDGNPRDTRWVLVLGRAYLGRFDGNTFQFDPGDGVPLETSSMSWAGNSWNHAPDGRRVWMTWLAESPLDWKHRDAQGRPSGNPTWEWNCALSLPTELTLRRLPEGLRLFQNPVPETESLRENPRHWTAQAIVPDTNLLNAVHGNCLELVAEFEPGEATEFGFKVRKGQGEETLVGYDAAKRILFVDRTRGSSVPMPGSPGRFEQPLEPQKGRVKIRVFVDWSVLEAFGNDGMVKHACVFYPSPSSDGVELYVRGGKARLVSLDVYDLQSVWRDDKAAKIPSKLLLDHDEIELPVGGRDTLAGRILPERFRGTPIRWASDNPASLRLTVDAADPSCVTLEGIAPGSALVTAATTDGRLTASCQLIVKQLADAKQARE